MDLTQPDVYLVILNNQLAKGRTLDEVVNNLSQVLNKKPEEINNLLCKQSFVVESGVSLDKAKATQRQIINAGIGCQIKKIPRTDTIDVLTLARNTQVICAKCGKQQSVSSNCEYCGVALTKYGRTNQKTNDTRTASRPSRPSSPHSNTARNIFFGLFLIIMMVFAISALNKNGQKNKHPITLDSGQVLYAIETHTIPDTEHYEDLIVPGYITIIDFSADWCPVCKRLNEFEDKLVDERDDIIVRKLDVTQAEDYRLALKKYELTFRGVPYSIIYGKNGELITNDSNSQREGQQYIHALINQ